MFVIKRFVNLVNKLFKVYYYYYYYYIYIYIFIFILK